MKPELLTLCGLTEAMQSRLTPQFTLITAPSPTCAHVLTDGHIGVSADVMAALPALQMVSCYGVGYDNIDTATCRARGVMVTHTPNVLNAEVATTAVMLMLACYRGLLRDAAYVRSGDWAAKGNPPLTRSADGQTIGLLGMGRIGQEIARKLAPWNPTLLYHSRTPKDVPYEHCPDLPDMARRCDVMIVITPGGAATRHLVNADVMKALGPQGTLINVARGSVVDEAALIAALQSGQLGWAGLDVFENEPHVPAALRDLPNTVLLPHVGSATVETRAAMGDLAVRNLLQHITDGTVLSPVPECADMV